MASATKLSEKDLVSFVQEALKFQKLGFFEDGEKIYLDLLKTDKKHPELNQLIGSLYLQWHKYNKALKHFKTAAKKVQNSALLLRNIGECHWHLEDYELALQTLKQAAHLNPKDATTLYLLGCCSHVMNQLKQAEDFYLRSLALEPIQSCIVKLADLYAHLGGPEKVHHFLEAYKDKLDLNLIDIKKRLVFGYSAKPEKAHDMLKLMVEILQHTPDDDLTLSILGTFVHTTKTLKYTENAKALIHLYLLHPKLPPREVFSCWKDVLEGDPDAQDLIACLAITDYETFQASIKKTPKILDYFLTDYFRLGIENGYCKTLELERLITFVRRYYLEKIAAQNSLTDLEIKFLAALGQLCFETEYVFSETEAEKAWLLKLPKNLKSGSKDDQNLTQALMIRACYAPDEDFYEALRASHHDNVYIQRLQKNHVDDPTLEKKLAAGIKSISPISDAVSQKVQQQYEENPYPRWMKTYFTPRFHEMAINHKYAFKPEIFIAGCGTGQQIFNVMSQYPHAKITAIDLSKASLGYAKRKIEELGITNIDLCHGDILDAAALKKDFDHIQCTGVLHHMKDPLAGWKVLREMLRPHGNMKIALYSDFARQGVVAARQIIQERHAQPDLDGIRHIREYIKSQTHSDDLKQVNNMGDFYATSDVRDLIFHVQEHRYTIPRLMTELEALNLKFDGFKLSKAFIKNDYLQKFPEDPDLINLENWAIFEKENPNTFIGMYQFHCSPKGA